MKTPFLIAFVAASVLSLSGCGDGNSSSAPQNSSAANNSNPIKQPIDYAEKKAGLAALSQAVQQYNVQEGHYPQDLQSLLPNYIGKIPDAPTGYKWSYDSTAGTVTMVQQ